MPFKVFPKKRAGILQSAQQTARKYDLSPDDFKIYTNRVHTLTVKTKKSFSGFGTLPITNHVRFTLKFRGKPFNYQGVMTKIYDRKSLYLLFLVEKLTITRWVQSGILTPPLLSLKHTVGRGSKTRAYYVDYWLYHQIQPVYIWFQHMKLKYQRISSVNQKELKLLHKLVKRQEKRWLARLGIEDVDPYIQQVGKYGVIMHRDL